MLRSAGTRAVLGAGVMAVALGAASVAYSAADDSWPGQLAAALLCTAIAVSLILLLRRRLEHKSLVGLGLVGGVRPFLVGLAVTGGSAALLFGIGTAAGWLDWGSFDLSTMLLFLLSNAIIAVLLEALPEELTLRGYTWTALRDRHRGLVAALGTTGLFLLVPGAGSVIQAGLGAVVGVSAPRPRFAPPGEDVVSYLILLTVFGLTLIAARTATGSLWTSIATHLTFLTVNRLTLFGDDRNAGWSADLVTPDAVLLIPGYLLLATIVYRLIARQLRPSRTSIRPHRESERAEPRDARSDGAYPRRGRGSENSTRSSRLEGTTEELQLVAILLRPGAERG